MTRPLADRDVRRGNEGQDSGWCVEAEFPLETLGQRLTAFVPNVWAVVFTRHFVRDATLLESCEGMLCN